MQARQRVVMFAPHFVEYALRTAIGLARNADVLAIVDEPSYRREVTPALNLTHPAVRILPVDFGVRGDRRFDLAALVAEVARFDPDVIHHQEQLPQVSTALMMRFRKQALQVLMVHDPFPHSSRVYELAPQTWSFIQRLRMAADLILVHGPENEQQLRQALPELTVPVAHVQHGVVLVPSDALRRDPVSRRILLFGWLQEHKGVEDLVDACSQLQASGFQHELVIAGSGPEPARLADKISGLANVEVITGFQKPEAAISLIQQASLVALPYRDATQSGVLAAAFANGRPVIATRTGDMPQLIDDGQNGLIVPPRDANALANAIVRAFSEPSRLAHMTAGAARTARTRMDWDDIADALAATYVEAKTQRAKLGGQFQG